jgi:GT2 family glycosyltransferase
MPQTKLSFVILNYNSQFWLKKTLSSLKEHYLDSTRTKIETIVVDNASQDASVSMIKEEFSWVKLMELDQNYGYAAGNNQSLKQIDAEYVMLLNNDVEFTAQSKIDEMLVVMDEHDQVAVATPKVMLANDELDWACHRGEPTPWAAFCYFLGLDKLFPNCKLFGQYHQTYKDLSQPHEIDACTGAAMLVRTKYMHEIGYLDERFFMYAEDLDWCKRFRDAGYKIIYLPQAEIVHHKYKSGIKTESNITSIQAKRHFYDTMLQYYDKHYRDQYPGFIRWLARLFIFIKKGGM